MEMISGWSGRLVPVCPEEEKLILAYRRGNSARKENLLVVAETVLKHQAEDEEILHLVAAGNPLNEKQTKAWNGWIKGYVANGEYKMPPRLRVVDICARRTGVD